MINLVTYLVLFALAHSIFLSYSFWVVRHTDSLMILGMRFSSVWTYWLMTLLVATPILSVANILVVSTFYFGFKEYKNAWLVLLTFIGAQVIAYPAMTYLWFKEVPHKGALVGAFLTLSGVVVTYFWKR